MTEVKVTVVKTGAVRYSCLVLWTNVICYDFILQLTERYTGFYYQDVYYMENNIAETYEDSHGKKNLPLQSSHKLTNMIKVGFQLKMLYLFLIAKAVDSLLLSWT